MYQTLIEKIEELQRNRLSVIKLEKNKLSYKNGPGTKIDGLYWIYTDYTDDELKDSCPSPKRGSINFSDLVKINSKISVLCKVKINKFRLVYNGIGGVGQKNSGGLRERILEEFRGGEGTGSLAICGSSLSDLSHWRVSYVLWSEIHFPKNYSYKPFCTAIEGLWRLHYGWPLLCKK